MLKRAVKYPVQQALGAVRDARQKRAFPPGAVHFLHVGKAAGSQIKSLTSEINAAELGCKFHVLSHTTPLAHVPMDRPYFFSTRDPITRFKSGFYSRKRKGRPLYDAEWSPFERVAFERFNDANDLAEALFASGQDGIDAVAAISAIRHTAQNLIWWFMGNGTAFSVRPPVWIIRQEHFADDMQELLHRLGLEAFCDRIAPDKRTHSNDYSDVPELSDKARENLKRWYVQDYQFLNMCEGWMAAQPRSAPQPGEGQ